MNEKASIMNSLLVIRIYASEDKINKWLEWRSLNLKHTHKENKVPDTLARDKVINYPVL